MNELRILIVRLSWPSTSSRWWAMQELAARLGEPAAKTETESALLQFLRSRKLEAEVVEVLCIFWMAVKAYGYSPCTELAASILQPSLLSNLILESFELPPQSEHNLRAVPEKFEMPDDFDKVQGADVPRIFWTSMNFLETRTRYPFVQQMAFEWTENRNAYPHAPYQGDPLYFSRPLGDEFIGQTSARAALRSISAYLRALAVAKQFWGMPQRFVDEYLPLALPVHPTLAFLKPHIPNWFPTASEFEGDNDSVKAAIYSLLTNIEATKPGCELIAFSSPVVMSMERCVEVSLVRWSQIAGGNIDDTNLADHLNSFWRSNKALSSSAREPLSTTTVVAPPAFAELSDSECRAWPLAATLDFNRMGYLQHDLYPSRLYFPTMPGFQRIEIVPNHGQLDVMAENQVIANFCYWNVGWAPVRLKQFQGNCGTALVSRGTVYRDQVDSVGSPTNSFYLWQVRTLYREGTYRDFEEKIVTGVIFI